MKRSFKNWEKMNILCIIKNLRLAAEVFDINKKLIFSV